MIAFDPNSMPLLAPADVQAGKPAGFSDEDLKRRLSQMREVSASFGEIVGLMLRSRAHRMSFLAELEWTVLPAIATRQFRVAEGVDQEKGLAMPVAVILWASVSAEVDRRLSQGLDQPIRLKPEEWRSGDIVWIVETIGEAKAVKMTLQHLKQNELKDRTVRMRVTGPDGKPVVGRVEVQAEGAGQSNGADKSG